MRARHHRLLPIVGVGLVAGCHYLLPFESPRVDDSRAPGSEGPRPERSGPAGPVLSCADLRARFPTAPSGIYPIDPDGEGGQPSFEAFCEQIADGGGWTLVLKADGRGKTFAFDAPLWTNQATLNPDSAGLDTTEAKLAGFNTMPFVALRVGLRAGAEARWMILDVKGESLSKVFGAIPPEQRGTPTSLVPTHAGRSAWLNLLPGASLQEYCDQEGLNNDDGWGSRVRIGIVTNNEANCGDTDSFIGLGGQEYWCSVPITSTVGNGDCGTWETPPHRSDIPAFGYVMVR